MFDSVFGHTQVKGVLQRMIRKDRLHHGLCFYGPGGIGKRLTARETARAMMCETREGCDTCRNCHKLASGNHPDYTEIHPDGNDIKVQQIRDIVENLHFKPFEARARVIVIDGAERLREEAANAFLKSLEEPPDYVYFILVTSDLKALLPTILSRCQKIAFQSLTHEDKCKILVRRFNLERGLALKLAGISFRELETEEAAWERFRQNVEKVVGFFQLLVEEGQAIDFLSETVRDKNGFPDFLDHLTATSRELCLLSLGLPGQPIFAEFRQPMENLVRACAPAYWRETWEEIVRLHGQRRRNLNQALWFNAMSVAGLDLKQRSRKAFESRTRASK